MQVSTIAFGVLNNTALLLSMVLVASFWASDERLQNRPLFAKLALGLVLAGIGITIMAARVEVFDGVVLDTRSLIICISGLFFGILPTVILAVATSLFRIYEGGTGAFAGVLVILASALIGCVWNRYRKGALTSIRFKELWLFGLVVHVVMLLLFLTIPWEIVLPLYRVIGLPVLLVYPVGTAVLGLLIRNVLQHRATQQKLTVSEQRYRNLFEQNRSTMLLIDPVSQRILAANQAAADYYGWSVDELKQMEISDINTLSREQIDAEVQRALSEEKSAFQFRHRLRDGSIRDVEVFTGPLDVDGKRCLYSLVYDVTERCELQNQLLELNRQYEQKAVEAEAANVAKSQFLANMSHEMRTPLNGIMGMNFLMLESDLTDEQRDYAETVNQCAEVLLHTIDDLLDLARVEAGYIDLKSEPFRPAELLEAVHALLEFRAKEKQLHLHIECSKAVPSSLLGDFGKLRQVLLNLVSNALKFTEKGGVQVRMDVDCISGGVAHVRIEVTDTGIGIHASDFDKLFRKFSQVHSGNTRRYPGSGLGLAICRSLVEAMDGSLAVSSKQGEGTTFSCLIPLAIDTADKRAEVAASGPVGANKSIQRINRGHVLLAEDNLINRRICEDFLRRLGVNYVAVGNGREALQQLNQQQFDLVLMDIQMPIMDGVAATRQIRDGAAGEVNRDINIIALTAHAIHGDQDRFLQQGMSDYIAKPMMMGTFAEKLRHWLPNDQVCA